MNALLAHPLLQRLGLTVLHALWELALLGVLAAVGLALLRGRSPRASYGWACTLLAAMVAVPVLTFLGLGGDARVAPGLVEAGSATVTLAGVAGPGSWAARVLGLAPLLALAWMLGAALMTARLGLGLWWLERTYLGRSEAAPEAWQAALDRLAARLGVRGPVRLRASRHADTPLLIGWLKPVILVPSAAFLRLAPEALEAVLAHELAHVRRSDYLTNLLQSLAEALLFFHPCAWWLSRRIRELREHCCDDAAATLCGDPLILAEGLTALERLRRSLTPIPEPALAAAKGSLMNRITRLFQPQVPTLLPVRSLAFAVAGASLLGAALLAGDPPKAQPAPSQPAAAAEPAPKAVEVDFAKVKVRHQPRAPKYPEAAKEQKIQGTVVLEILVDEAGVPTAVKALEGPEALCPTAIEYAKAWRFEPYRVKGKPTPARFKLTMPFRLR